MSYCSPATLLRIPYSLTEAVVWTVLVYFEVNLAPTAGRFVSSPDRRKVFILIFTSQDQQPNLAKSNYREVDIRKGDVTAPEWQHDYGEENL